jgi:group I intron endonuclease
MEEKRCGIYCIENNINHKKYIGQSENLQSRMYEKHYECAVLRKAFSLYGIENFSIYVIEECPVEAVNEREMFYIKELHSHVTEWGYNVSWGGSAPMRNRKHSQETRDYLSESRKGEKNWAYGKNFSPEHCKNLSKSRIESGIARLENNPNFDKKSYSAKSQYHGITFREKYKQWIARCYTGKDRIYIGSFKTEERAARAYDAFVKENNLPNALNFPNE